MADGSLIFDTRIDTDGFVKGTNTIKSQTTGLVNVIKSAGENIRRAFRIDTAASKNQTESVKHDIEGIEKSADEVGDKISQILNQEEKSMKSKAASIAAIYKKQGMDQSEAMKKAWEQIERSAKQSNNKIVKDSKNTSKKISTYFGNAGQNIAGTFKKIGITLAGVFTIGKLVQLGKEAIGLASDMQEVQNVVDAAFGEMTYKMEEFAHTAIEMYGISKLSAKQTGSTFMAMAKSMGLAAGSASDMALTLTGLSADMASFYNVKQDVASTALKSIFTGETETLKQYGIVMTELNLQEFAATQGIKKKVSAMTQAEKVQLRYNYVMSQTALAQGDFAKTSNSWANQTRILAEQWKEFLGILGNGLIQVLTPVVQFLNTALSQLISFANAVGNVLGKIFGLTKSANSAANATTNIGAGASGAGSSIGELADETESAGKKINKSLSSFDDLNQITQNTASNASKASGGIAGVETGGYEVTDTQAMDTSNLEAETSKIMDILEPLLLLDFEPLNQSIENFKQALHGISSKIGEGLKWIYDNVLVPLASWSITDVIPAFLDVLSAVLNVFSAAATALSPIAVWFFDSFLAPLASWTGGVIVDVLKSLAEKLEAVSEWIINNQETVRNMALVIGAFFIAWKVKKITDVISEMGLFDIALLALKSPIGKVVLAITGLIAAIVLLTENWDTVKEVAEEVWGKVTDIFEEFDTYLTTVFQIDFSASFGAIGDVLNSFFANAENIWGSLKSIFTGIITFITGTFSLDWEKAWTGIKDAFGGIFELIEALAKSPINLVIGLINGMIEAVMLGINTLIRAVNKLSFTAPSWIPGIGGQSFGFNIPEVTAPKIPYLATGAVIPPNSEFLAVLGDQKHGVNIEAPLETIVEAFQQVSGNQKITIQFVGQPAEFVRWLKPQLDKESARRGTQLVVGGV